MVKATHRKRMASRLWTWGLLAASVFMGPVVAGAQTTSVDKINQALSAGSITTSQALDLKYTLLTDYQNLPTAYQVPVDGTLKPVGPFCGTPLVLEILQSQGMSKRTVDGAGLPARVNSPTYTDEETYDSPAGYFKVHYSTSDQDGDLQLKQYDVNPADGVADDSDGDGYPDVVEDIANYYDWCFVIMIGNSKFSFRQPIRDGEEGGDNRMDIYLDNLVGGLAGVTWVEEGVPYFLMPVDYTPLNWPCREYLPLYQYIKGNIKCICAHEFFHSVQNSYDLWGEGTNNLVAEGTAMFMMDTVFDSVDADLLWMPVMFNTPDTDILNGDYDTYPYWKYLAETYGTDGSGNMAYQVPDPNSDPYIDPRGVDFVKAVWEEGDEPGVSWYQAIEAAILRTDAADFLSTTKGFRIASACKELGNTTWQDFTEDTEWQEPFEDLNSNGAFDIGEPYTDWTGDGEWDSGYPKLVYEQETNLLGNDSLNLGDQSVLPTGADFFLFNVSATAGTLTLIVDGQDYVDSGKVYDFLASLVLVKNNQIMDIQTIGLPQPTNKTTIVQTVQGYDRAILIVEGGFVGGSYAVTGSCTAVTAVTSSTGWMQASNNMSIPMVGMELYGDSKGNMAGILAESTPITTGYLPHYRLSTQWWTGVAFANPNASAAVVKVSAYGDAGLLMGETEITVPGQGQYSRLVNTLFAPSGKSGKALALAVNDPTTGWIKFEASLPIVGMEIFGNNTVGGLAALSATTEGTEFYILHVVSDTSWYTGIAIVNLDFTNVTNLVKIESYKEDGTQLKPPIYQGLQPGEKWVGLASNADFLGLTSGTGWIKVVAQGPVVALETIGQLTASGIGALASASIGNTQYLPRLVKSSTQTTGIAVINTSTSSTTVTLTAYAKSGQELASRTLVLPARAKVMGYPESPKLFGPSFPATAEGYVKIVAAQPLACMETIQNLNGSDFVCEPGVVTTGTKLVYPHFATGQWWTQYSLTNLGVSGALRTLTIYSTKGTLLVTNSTSIARSATEVGNVVDLLP